MSGRRRYEAISESGGLQRGGSRGQRRRQSAPLRTQRSAEEYFRTNPYGLGSYRSASSGTSGPTRSKRALQHPGRQYPTTAARGGRFVRLRAGGRAFRVSGPEYFTFHTPRPDQRVLFGGGLDRPFGRSSGVLDRVPLALTRCPAYFPRRSRNRPSLVVVGSIPTGGSDRDRGAVPAPRSRFSPPHRVIRATTFPLRDCRGRGWRRVRARPTRRQSHS